MICDKIIKSYYKRIGVMKYILVILIILTYPFNINAKPITIFGLNMEMEEMELVSAVTERGYYCQEITDYLTFEKKETYSYFLCKDNNKEIKIWGDWVDFNCWVFNACEYTFHEIQQSIADQGIVDYFSYETDTYYWRGMPVYDDKYCARGEEGDKLCINDKKEITLSKAQLGDGGMSFQ